MQRSSSELEGQCMVPNPDQYRLSAVEHRRIFESEIKPAYLGDAISATEPIAIIFGGQPGAGKSAALDTALRVCFEILFRDAELPDHETNR